MPVPYSFYNHGKVRLAVMEGDVLKGRKKFFGTGTSWKDFAGGMTFADYEKMTDRQRRGPGECVQGHGRVLMSPVAPTDPQLSQQI